MDAIVATRSHGFKMVSETAIDTNKSKQITLTFLQGRLCLSLLSRVLSEEGVTCCCSICPRHLDVHHVLLTMGQHWRSGHLCQTVDETLNHHLRLELQPPGTPARTIPTACRRSVSVPAPNHMVSIALLPAHACCTHPQSPVILTFRGGCAKDHLIVRRKW
eukprot:2314388-Amphidinium_carterae.1